MLEFSSDYIAGALLRGIGILAVTYVATRGLARLSGASRFRFIVIVTMVVIVGNAIRTSSMLKLPDNLVGTLEELAVANRITFDYPVYEKIFACYLNRTFVSTEAVVTGLEAYQYFLPQMAGVTAIEWQTYDYLLRPDEVMDMYAHALDTQIASDHYEYVFITNDDIEEPIWILAYQNTIFFVPASLVPERIIVSAL